TFPSSRNPYAHPPLLSTRIGSVVLVGRGDTSADRRRPTVWPTAVPPLARRVIVPSPDQIGGRQMDVAGQGDLHQLVARLRQCACGRVDVDEGLVRARAVHP